MVLSSIKKPFDDMYRMQRNTWDSVKHDQVDTVYYFGNDYEKMHIPFMNTLRDVWCGDWDIIFRTNSSSYVDKHLMYEYIKDKPKERLWISSNDGQMSGAGFFMSRDLLQVLLDSKVPKKHEAEDMWIAHTIHNATGILPEAGQRSQYNHVEHKYDKCYHIRCKDWDRNNDLKAMQHIFETINN
jgi:hypothetical protein